MLLFYLISNGMSIITLPAWHPNVNLSLSLGLKASSIHPNIQDLLSADSNNFNNTVNHPDVNDLILSGTPLPPNHPDLQQYISYQSFDYTYKRVLIKSYWHPSIDSLLNTKTSAPDIHPSVNQYFINDVPASHPNIDDIIKNISAYQLPPYHPPIDPFVGFNSTRPDFTVKVPFWHSSIDQLISLNSAASASHPLVDGLFRKTAAFPIGHTNIDLIIANPKKYVMPKYHPSIDYNVQINSRSNLTVAELPWWHPKIDMSMGLQAPKDHPSINSLFNNTMDFPSNHPDIDLILANPTDYKLPFSHPAIDPIIRYDNNPLSVAVNVYDGLHPDIDASFEAGFTLPDAHPKISQFFEPYLPPSHPNVDEILNSPSKFPLPSWHISISSLVGNVTKPVGVASVLPSWHPNITNSFINNVPIPKEHHVVNNLFVSYLPQGHPNIDDILSSPSKYTMPSWHVKLDEYITYNASSTVPLVNVPYWHPNADNMFWAMYSSPAKHPKVHGYFAASFDFPPNHPNVDDIIAFPSNYTIPNGHPKINSWITTQNPPVMKEVTKVYSQLHPNIDISLASGRSVPEDHPKVGKFFSKYVPANHPDIDEILASPNAYPFPSSWHPSVNAFVGSMPLPVPEIVVTLPKWHPLVNETFSAGIAAPSYHPAINSSFSRFLPDDHPDVDYIIANPGKFKFPSFHPQISNYIAYELSATTIPVATLPKWHPDIQKAYLAGEAAPEGHPSVDESLAAVLPKNHKSVDKIISNPTAYPLPSYHPAISEYITQDPLKNIKIVSSLPYWHPKIMESYAAGIPTPNRHLLFQSYFENLMPDNHPNVDQLLAKPSAFKMPVTHPDLDIYVSYRARFRPGHLLCTFLLLVMLVSTLIRFTIRHLFKSSHSTHGFSLSEKDMLKLSGSGTTSDLSIAEELCMSPTPLGKKELYASNGTVAQRDSIKSEVRGSILRSSLVSSTKKAVRFQAQESVISVGSEDNALELVECNEDLPKLDMLQYKIRLQQSKFKSNELYDYANELPPLPSSEYLKLRNRLKDSSLYTTVVYSRIPYTNLNAFNVALSLVYILINAVALLYPYGLQDLQTGFASLAIANAIVLVIPITFLSGSIGLGSAAGTFHKYIGIWAIILTLTHVGYYVPTLHLHMKEFVYWTGLGGTAAMLILIITSTNFVRKYNFKMFWYGHYAGLGAYGLGFLHVQEARPFIVVGVFIIACDWVWKAYKRLPQRTMVFENKGEDACHVRLVNHGAEQKHGQYFYVNFPEISFSEWYPFWVSSGAREDGIELCIRAQNDYTQEVVKHSKVVEISGKLPWARVSGPFGGTDFNFRRYPVLMLVGGGNGITPVVSILKDIYHVGKYKPALSTVLPHSMEAVYLVWIMPTVEDAAVFLKEIKKSMNNSSLSKFPPLVMWIYITRSLEKLEEPLTAGRPDFKAIFDEVEGEHPGKSTMIFAAGPQKMISEVYEEGLRRERGGSRVDFEYISL